jgi:hypothetical protein
MAIVNSVRNLAPGIGSANYYANSLTPAGTSVASGAVRVPNGTALLQPACRAGNIRVKITGTGGAITSVTGTDGTNIANLYGSVTFPATGTSSELVITFITDINCTSLTANTTGGTATDVEVIYSV